MQACRMDPITFRFKTTCSLSRFVYIHMIFLFLTTKKSWSIPKADRIAELGPHALATGKFIPVSTLPSHNHNPKRIGDKFPPGGYGQFDQNHLTCVILFFLPKLMNHSKDDYYAFTHITKIPTRIPLADFTPKLDLLIDLLRPSSSSSSNDVGGGYRAEPVVEVSSAKSGFKLVFDTNRKSLPFSFHSFHS